MAVMTSRMGKWRQLKREATKAREERRLRNETEEKARRERAESEEKVRRDEEPPGLEDVKRAQEAREKERRAQEKRRSLWRSEREK